MGKITHLKATQINDSNGKPTVQVELKAGKGTFTAACPSGESTGMYEAMALPAAQAVDAINKILAKRLTGLELSDQKEFDELLLSIDGTENKSHLGANALLPVSIAACRALAAATKTPLYRYIATLCDRDHVTLPLPSFNVVEGGAHTTGRNTLDLQEFMVVPQKKSFVENFALASKIFANLQRIVKENYGENVAMGDEGGFAPPITKAEQALFLLKNAIGSDEAAISIDAAASQFLKEGKYMLEDKEISRDQLIDFYKDLVGRFPIIAIEDPFSENDWMGFAQIRRALPTTIIIGDDLTTTNIKRIKEAEHKKACNGVIIKPNQIGTVWEALEASRLAKSYGWNIIVSHRAGETIDDFIADLAVGVGADFIKSGSPTQPERMVKYKRLIEIEHELK